jgi:PKD repeat protein
MFSVNLATLRARVSILLAACAVLLLAVIVLNAVPASAASGYAYEEAARFGGFDTSAYDGGHYGGMLTPGKFVDPTGFAVDTHDSSAPNDTALYVVDRTSGLGGEHTSWRLQKLNDLGQVLGSTTFQLPNDLSEQSGISGLAVNDSGGEGQVYALIVGNDSTFTGYAYAKEIVAWSTKPNGSNQLVAPTGLSTDPLGSTGGLVSSSAQLAGGLSSEHALYDPQGIALDVTSAGAHDLAIEATDGTGTGRSGVSSIPGVAGVWQVSTEPGQGGHPTGTVLGSWSARALASLPGVPQSQGEAAPYGISTNADDSLSVLLAEDSASAPTSSDIDVVKLSSDLTDPQLVLSSANEPIDQDRAVTYLSEPPGVFSGDYVSQAPWASAGLVQLSSGLYAGDIEHEAKLDDPYKGYESDYYWRAAETTTNGVANVGVRLLQPNAAGEISDAKGETIVNTLGYSQVVKEVLIPGGACNLDAEAESLAAGTEGTLWVLGRGLDSSSGSATGTLGRQIVEFKPGSGAGACPQPSGGFTVSSTSVSAGATVEFNADSVNLQNGAPFAYEWDLDNEGFTLVNELGKRVNEDGVEVIEWPPSTASFTYTKPGTYMIKLRIRSDYGTYEAPTQEVHVSNADLPVAKFTVSANPTAGLPVQFNASESVAKAKGATITNYHWEWGDGSTSDLSSSSAEHEYAAAGSYPVTLTVRDSNGLTSEVFSETITVAAGSGGGNGGGSAPPTITTATTPQSPPTITTPTPIVKPISSTPPPLTTAQKLANALKTCKKKPKKQRASCEKQAKKQYSPKKKNKKKKK